MNINIEAIDRYFNTCIEEAHKSENRVYNPDKTLWLYALVGNEINYVVQTPFTRVNRRVSYRLNNNLGRNFGLVLSSVYFIDTVLQPNFVCNHTSVSDKDFYLCKVLGEIEISKIYHSWGIIPCTRYERLCAAYHDVTSRDEFQSLVMEGNYHIPFNKMSWSDYREVYKKAFGKYPEINVIWRSNKELEE